MKWTVDVSFPVMNYPYEDFNERELISGYIDQNILRYRLPDDHLLAIL